MIKVALIVFQCCWCLEADNVDEKRTACGRGQYQ
jgi:hypothetical protein